MEQAADMYRTAEPMVVADHPLVMVATALAVVKEVTTMAPLLAAGMLAVII